MVKVGRTVKIALQVIGYTLVITLGWFLAIGIIGSAFPKVIPVDNGIAILNDVTIVNGVLIGFVTLLAGQNISKANQIRDASKQLPKEFRWTKMRELLILIALDFAVILFSILVIVGCLVAIANLTPESPSVDVWGLIGDTVGVVILLMMRTVYSIFPF